MNYPETQHRNVSSIALLNRYTLRDIVLYTLIDKRRKYDKTDYELASDIVRDFETYIQTMETELNKPI